MKEEGNTAGEILFRKTFAGTQSSFISGLCVGKIEQSLNFQGKYCPHP
jgi:hypothetical protein